MGRFLRRSRGTPFDYQRIEKAETMPIRKNTIPLLIVILLLPSMVGVMPNASMAEAALPAAASWIAEGLQAWGDHDLAVDFGARGLWSYNGAWMQLSRLDPESMATWGGGLLAVNFGVHGVWTYNGRAWLKISSGGE
jgi:hypothetical protein